MKILIGTPFKDMAASGYIKSLANLISYTVSQGHQVDYVAIHGGLYNARDQICRKTVRGNYDYMLQIDSDQTFPKDALCRMLDRDLDVCTGIYVGGEIDHKPVLFTELFKDSSEACAHASKKGLTELMQTDVFEVAGCGAGFLLVNQHILRLMMIHIHEWFKPYEGLGEDVSFCQRAREMGFKIYADNTFSVGHIKYIVQTLDDWTGLEDELTKGENNDND